jgi:peptidoglycan glycosyltransferase
VGRRIRWLGVVLLICFALVVVQLVNIQFRQSSALANSVYNPRVSSKQYDNQRGTITAADGTILAKSVKINSSHSTYNYEREYPDGPLFAGITGYDSPFFGAAAGIEYQYNQYLQTHAQAPQNFSQLLFDKPPAKPDNVSLTVDPVLQAAATNALKSYSGANKDGGVVVLNPSTGAVLALASNPTFDPNSLSNPSVPKEKSYAASAAVNDKEGFNGLAPIATEESFFPGSTFKVVTTAAVYNLKPSLINYSFPPAVSISFPDSNKTLSNDGLTPCGGTMAVMLPASCDPGYGELGIELGSTALTQEAKDFGFSVYQSGPQTVPGLDLPHVAVSTISNLSATAQADLAYSAIGQLDDQATPLQNALVAAGIANGGTVMTPHLLTQVTDSQGAVITTYKPTTMSTVTTPAEAAQITTLMQAVAVNGTAAGIFPASWHIAVKTGTAQVQAPNVPEQTDDWMIGFLPGTTGASQLAIAVVVPYQAFSLTGAAVAGPIIKQVVQAYLGETGSQG